ncbi:glycoside hydrolase family 47 protein [Aulographum hederae CBS 113979]|uniref:alpha-1,2-Mannosidase n=1 Tax=Aulographum hederae CBS 113979 TaxID=1176131 RepID=A0A6G1GZF1_9PEZI|nr:glycoside hydrolase family 47 protein [Aulographum hederae CBS 113979]
MSLVNRRSRLLLLVVIFFISTTLFLRNQIIPPQNSRIPSQSVASTSTDDEESASDPEVSEPGVFSWKDVAERYPVRSFAQLPTGRPSPLPKIQYDFPANVPDSSTAALQRGRQLEVKRVFKRCWDAYKEYAWLHDELKPLTLGFANPFGGWSATLIDNLDTLWIMGFKDEYDMAVEAAANINFGPESSMTEVVNVFETTIRHLGGILSAYDLTGGKDERLLRKAIELGDMLYASFDTPNRMPVTRWKPRAFVTGEIQRAADSGILAELASSSLEFTRLSQVTGDPKYFDAIQRITNIMDEQQNKTKLPGMWPIAIDVATPNLLDGSEFGIGAMADSAFEYLPKMYALLGGLRPADQYLRMYNTFIETAITHLFFRPMTPTKANILFSGKATTSRSSVSLIPEAQHLSCFVGGMVGLGGRLSSNTSQDMIARQLTDGCIWAYNSSLLGIMPETFQLLPCPSHAPCPWDEPAWRAAAQKGRPPGFTTISDAHYNLRPEAIESIFYLYRMTGDASLQDTAWDMFKRIEKQSHTTIANAAIRDVTVNYAPKTDRMESFWLAETLKYFFLLFGEEGVVGLDEWVFNTEAHPFRIPK